MRLNNGDVLFTWPTPAPHKITAGWTYSDGSKHDAMDLGCSEGTPVYAMESGIVDTVQYWNGSKTGMQSYGNMIRITHSNYMNKSLQTRYAHLQKILVKYGQQVKEGDVIGYVGNTGNSFGAHLHCEVIWIGIRRNPLSWLDNDFEKKYDHVRLGTYKSIIRPMLQNNINSDSPIKIYFNKYTGISGSIVEALLAVGSDSSFTYRAKIAAKNNIINYSGTAQQNIAMLNMLKSGVLVKP